MLCLNGSVVRVRASGLIAALTLAVVGWLGVREASAQDSMACAVGEISLADKCTPADEVTNGLRAVVDGAIKTYDLKAFLLSAKVGDTAVIEEAWGQSMTGVPATPDMHWRNGAIAIPYLTMILLQLNDEGVLSLEDTVSKWFPDYPKAGRVTLKMLANCTSGYADYVPVLPITENVFRAWQPDELLKIAFSHEMACEPGTCFKYAHTNFVILGDIFRKATGKPVEDLIRERISLPLGLKDTRSAQTAVVQEPVLHAFTSERGVYEDATYWDPSWTLARGAVMTTNVADALTSAIAIGSGRLLTPESHRKLLAPSTASLPPMTPDTYYGLGLVVTNGWVMQTPSFAGYAAVIGYLPSRRIGFAISFTMGPNAPDKQLTLTLGNQIGAALAPDQPPKLPER